MSVALFLRMVFRQTRGARARLLFFGACVAIGVSAVVGVAALVDAIELGIRARSRELLGGDLALESRRPLPDVMPMLASRRPELRKVDLTILSTMVRSESGLSRLAELKAIDTARGSYPLAGTLELEPARPLRELLDEDAVLVAPELLAQLKIGVNDSLQIGGQRFRVAGVVKREPDPLTFSFSLGPRVLMTEAALARTRLLGFGSRVRYRSVLSFPAGTREAELAREKRTLQERVPGGHSYVSVETHAEAQPALRMTLDRVQRYLGLVALLSLLLASVGIAQIVSAWLAQAVPETAILRCLGLRPREVVALYLGQVLALALVGSLVGAALGAALPAIVADSHPVLLPPGLALTPPWAALGRGVALGVGVPALFSLPALSSVFSISPARVLRSAEPLPLPWRVRALAGSLAAAGLFLAGWVQSRELGVALAFAGCVAALAGLLWLAARALSRAVARLPRARLPALIWQGAAALARPAAGTTGSIVALGLGALVVLAIALVEGVLEREIATALPADAPSVFLVDIQPDQWPGVAALCRELGATRIDSAPVAMARLLAVDGHPVEALLKQRPGDPNERGRAHWVLTREQRVSWMRELPRDNQIVEGALWSEPGAQELSVELEFARDLGAELGSRLRFDVQGVAMEFKVTSLRKVEWRSFSTNFFFVAEPGSLDDAPHFRLGAVRVPPSAEELLQNRLAARYPNVTVLRVEDLLQRALSVLAQAALAVRLLGGFAVASGLIALAGAIASTRLRRAREAALLKTLGLTRAQVIGLFAVEYALSGAVAGVLGAAGGYALAALFSRQLLELSSWPPWRLCAQGLLATIALAVAGGLAASARALSVRPLAVLRARL